MGGWAATAAPLSSNTVPSLQSQQSTSEPSDGQRQQHPTLGPGFKPKTETQNHFCDAQFNIKSESFSIKYNFLLTS